MGDCVLGLGWGKEPPCMSPKVVIGAMGINGLIRGHLPDWVSRGGPRGMASGSQFTHLECHEHALWDYLHGGGKR